MSTLNPLTWACNEEKIDDFTFGVIQQLMKKMKIRI